jgi:hypothetical protein
MSASSMHYRSSGRTWRDVSPRLRCPVCGSDSWCQVGTGEAEGVVLCKRVANGPARTNAEGVEFWVHGGTGSTGATHPARPARIGPRRIDAPTSRPSIATIDAVYRRLLGALDLTDAHRAGLLTRGLSSADVAHGEYRSLPLDWRARKAVAAELLASFGDVAAGVPGVVQDRRGEWTLAGLAGLLIPMRDEHGRIRGLKIRRDEMATQGTQGTQGAGTHGAPNAPRYTVLSSSSHGGPSAETIAHVPRSVRLQRGMLLLRITEGELKADVATALSGVPTISVPGIGRWIMAFDVVHVAQPARVEVVFDHDEKPATRERTAACALALVNELRSAGYRAARLVLDGREGKGIDDVLLHRARAGRAA